jgi:MFS family permease
MPNKAHADYILNWYVEYDLMCEDKMSISGIASYYYIGFFFGMFFFFFPDQYGRKLTMVMSLLMNFISSGMVIFGGSMYIKTIGFFISGAMHIKSTLAYCYIEELVPHSSTEAAFTFLSFYDTVNIALSCLYIMYVDNDVSNYLRINYALSVVGGIIFFFIIPESPKYLFMKDSKSKKAIDNMNFIAWFNGSKFRLPEDAQIDEI